MYRRQQWFSDGSGIREGGYAAHEMQSNNPVLMAQDNIQDRNKAVLCDKSFAFWKKVQSSFSKQMLSHRKQKPDLMIFEFFNWFNSF